MSAVPTIAVQTRDRSRTTRRPLWRSAVAVFRMHFTDPMTLIVFPVVLLASIFAITLIVWTLIPGDGGQGWGEMSVYCFLAAIAALAVTRSLPFSLGMGSSRRAFVLGTLLTNLVLGASWGVLLFGLQRVEKASGGWGQHAHFFWWDWYARSAWPAALLLQATSLAAAFDLGALLAAVWVRWNRLALLVGGPASVVVLGGVAILATSQHWWDSLANWFGDLTPLSATGACAAALAVLLLLQYTVLRRVRV